MLFFLQSLPIFSSLFKSHALSILDGIILIGTERYSSVDLAVDCVLLIEGSYVESVFSAKFFSVAETRCLPILGVHHSCDQLTVSLVAEGHFLHAFS